MARKEKDRSDYFQWSEGDIEIIEEKPKKEKVKK